MKISRYLLSLTLSLSALSSLSLMTSTASAQDSAERLLRFSPEDSSIIIGVEVHEAIKNEAISSLVETLYLGRGAHEFKTVAADKFGMTFERDVHAAVISIPSPAQDQGLTDQLTFIISGKFDAQKIKHIAKKLERRKVGKLQVWSDPTLDFAFIDPKTIAIVVGSTTYREQAWATISGESKSTLKNPTMSALIKNTHAKNHQAWVIVDARKIAQPKGSPAFNDVVIKLNTQAGLKLDADATMRTPEDSANSVKLIETMRPGLKKELARIEATPAIEQLTYKATHDKLSLSTSLTPTQSLKIAQQIRAIRLKLNKELPDKAAPQP